MDKNITPWHLQNLERWNITVVQYSEGYPAFKDGTVIAEFTLSGTQIDIRETLRDNIFLMKYLPKGEFAKLYRGRFEMELIQSCHSQ